MSLRVHTPAKKLVENNNINYNNKAINYANCGKISVFTGNSEDRAIEKYHDFDSEVIIGRSHDCQVRLIDESVSRRHAKIVRDSLNKFIFYNLSITNPSRVNGKIIEDSIEIKSNDLLKIGNIQLIFNIFNPWTCKMVESHLRKSEKNLFKLEALNEEENSDDAEEEKEFLEDENYSKNHLNKVNFVIDESKNYEMEIVNAETDSELKLGVVQEHNLELESDQYIEEKDIELEQEIEDDEAEAEQEAEVEVEVEQVREEDQVEEQKVEAEQAGAEDEVEVEQEAEAKAEQEFEMEIDQEVEQEIETTQEVEVEIESDQEAEAESEQEVEIEQDQKQEQEVEATQEAEVEIESEVEVEQESEAEAELKVEADAEQEPEQEQEQEREQECEQEIEGEQEAEVEIEGEVEVEQEAEVELESEIEQDKEQEHEQEHKLEIEEKFSNITSPPFKNISIEKLTDQSIFSPIRKSILQLKNFNKESFIDELTEEDDENKDENYPNENDDENFEEMDRLTYRTYTEVIKKENEVPNKSEVVLEVTQHTEIKVEIKSTASLPSTPPRIISSSVPSTPMTRSRAKAQTPVQTPILPTRRSTRTPKPVMEKIEESESITKLKRKKVETDEISKKTKLDSGYTEKTFRNKRKLDEIIEEHENGDDEKVSVKKSKRLKDKKDEKNLKGKDKGISCQQCQNFFLLTQLNLKKYPSDDWICVECSDKEHLKNKKGSKKKSKK